MKNGFLDKFFLVVALGALFGALLSFYTKPGRADTGWEGATRTERGSYISIRQITVSSTTGTSLFAADVKRADGFCVNNSANVVWIGTTSATMQNVTHSNITNGLPVLSSGTFKLDGSMPGVVYVTADIGVASVDMRCIDGLVR